MWRTDHPTDGASLTVIRADPRILVDAGLLEEIRNGNNYPDVSLVGDVLTIDAVNQRVIYRIGEYLPDKRAHVAEWPD